MAKLIDHMGQRFGRLVVVELLTDVPPWKQWRCQCDCGGDTIARGGDLRMGRVLSCGCLMRERTRERSYRHGASARHAMTPEYRIWLGMRQRCSNAKTPAFQNYGGRGIHVDTRWDSFVQFLADVGPRPSSRHSLDRIDNNGPYSPENCRWATYAEQFRNMRKNVWIEFHGERMIAADWARRIGIGQKSLTQRIAAWGVERALTTPPAWWAESRKKAA